MRAVESRQVGTFHSQSLLGCKTQKVCHSPPEFISIPTSRDNGLSFEEVEAGFLIPVTPMVSDYH
ncbi:MAG: hypothetical protein WBE46_09630 [Dehalococcoidia bacterium]